MSHTQPISTALPPRASEVIDRLLLPAAGERLLLGELLTSLHERAFGLAMTLLVLPNCLPVPGIPYMSTVTGVPILLLAGQLLIGRNEPWLPARMARWGMSRSRLASFWRRVRPGVLRLERHLQPRLLSLTEARAERALAGAIMMLAFILALPIPFANLLPAWGILLLALGITERDGRVIIGGFGVSVLALCWLAVLAVAGSYLAGLAGAGWLWLRATLGI